MPIVEGPSVEDLVSFLRDYYKQDVLELANRYPREQTSLTISFTDLNAAYPSLAQDYLDDPEVVSERLDEALRQYDLPVDIILDDAQVRVTDLPDPRVYNVGKPRVSEIKTGIRGIRGQVAKRSQNKQVLHEAVYECVRCGTFTTVPQTGDTRTTPGSCAGCDREGPFRLDMDESTTVDHQLLRLQTPPESGGSRTETIDVEVDGDLVGDVEAGDRLIANCDIELRPESEDSLVFEPIGHAHSLDRLESDYSDLDVSQYIDRITEIANSGRAMELIVASVLPSHDGDELVKQAIALQMFGGVTKQLSDESTKRGTIHVLLVGDPGCGKSALLKYASELSPRSVYATGKGSSAAGLTAAAVRDDFGDGGWTLEAGALVEATGGMCAIDELDDMRPEDRDGLLQALSSQEVPISKAGINATLPADTTVLSAANPSYGRFTEQEPLADQLDLDPVLLSRFDLIFTLQDKPDEERDQSISETITTAAREGQRRERGETVDSNVTQPDIEPEVLRAYIAHARTLVPVLTEAAAARIQEQYLKLRGASDENGPIAVTPRMNEALIRLAEASARVRLSDEITIEDVDRAATLHKHCLQEVGIDPDSGEFDVDIIETGTSKSQRDRIRSVKGLIMDLETEYTDGAPYEEIVESADVMDIDEQRVKNDIKKLKENGEIYAEKGDTGPGSAYRTS